MQIENIQNLIKDYSNSHSQRIQESIAIDKLNNKEQNKILASVSDLGVDAKYEPYLRARLIAIGAAAFIEAADKARKFGKQKDRYFICLIRA